MTDDQKRQLAVESQRKALYGQCDVLLDRPTLAPLIRKHVLAVRHTVGNVNAVVQGVDGAARQLAFCRARLVALGLEITWYLPPAVPLALEGSASSQRP